MSAPHPTVPRAARTASRRPLLLPRGKCTRLSVASGAALVVLTGLLVLTPWVRELDADLRRWVLGLPVTGADSSGAPHLALRGATLLGQRGVTLPVLLAAALWRSWTCRSTTPVRTALTGLLLLAVAGAALKYGLGRPAPGSGIDGLRLGGQSFPSGHTANAVLTAGLLVRLLRGPTTPKRTGRPSRSGAPLAAAAGLLTGAAVILLDYHWASDVVAGLLLGLCLLALLKLPQTQADGAAARSIF